MDLNDTLIALREVLYATPSVRAWERSLDVLEALALHDLEGAQVALDYAAPLLAKWPAALKPARQAWRQPPPPVKRPPPMEFYPSLIPLSGSLSAKLASPSPYEIGLLCDCLHPNLQTLDLRLPNAQAWKPKDRRRLLGAIPRSLETLQIEANALNQEDLDLLGASLAPSLRALRFSWVQHGVNCLPLAQSLPATLRALDLSHNPLYGAPTTRIGAHLPERLEELRLSGCSLWEREITALAPKLPRGLVSLDLGQNTIRDDGLRALARNLPPGLRALTLDGCRAMGDALLVLAEHLPASLVRVSLGACFVIAPWIEALVRGMPRTLVDLNLWCDFLQDGGVAAMAPHLPPRLQALRLGNNGITRLGLEALWAALPPDLVALDLSHNQLNEADLGWLAERLPPQLRVLRLHNNPTGALDLDALFPCMGATHKHDWRGEIEALAPLG